MSGWVLAAAAEIEADVAEMERLRARVLARIREVDAAEGWRYDGAAHAAGWLVARLGVSHATARSWVEVAGKLGELPELAAVHASGGVSFDQVAAACRFATPEDDVELAAELPGQPVSRVQREAARRYRDAELLGPAREQRRLRWWWDDPARMLKLQGALPSAEGAVVVKALERLVEQQPGDPDAVGLGPVEARRADALIQLASQALGADADADRATVVVHVEAAALAGGGAETDSDLPIDNDMLRRLACDARIETVFEERRVAVGIGRASRRIPAWLSRQVVYRDRGCRFPGCERTRWIHLHHLVHWIDGGATDLDNLVTLCGFHHRLLHEQGWKVTGDPNRDLGWVRPDGTPYDPTKSRLRQTIETIGALNRQFTTTIQRK